MIATRRFSLEICVDTLASALKASAFGADRIELCADLALGGTTPSLGLIQAIKKSVSSPIYMMLRPRAGDFCYTARELETLKYDVDAAINTGIDGFVFGALTPAGHLDTSAIRTIMAQADGKPFTLHRAFDMSRDWRHAAETAVELGMERILTSGQAACALDGLEILSQLYADYGNAIRIMAGGGLKPENTARLLQHTGIEEVHLSAKVAVPSAMIFRQEGIAMGSASGSDEFTHFEVDPHIVQAMRRLLDQLALSK